MTVSAPSGPIRNAEPPKIAVRVLNPIMKLVLSSPLARRAGKGLMLLTVTGRRSGRRITVPVGRHEVDGVLTVVAGGQWKLNLRGGAPVELVIGGRPRTGRAELEEDPDAVARVLLVLLEQVGLDNARRLGLEVLEPRIPSHEELRAAIAGRKAVARIAVTA